MEESRRHGVSWAASIQVGSPLSSLVWVQVTQVPR